MPGTPILILGDEGTGKSSSLRNLPAEQTVIITPNNKPLPFRGSSKKYVWKTPENKGNVYQTASLKQVEDIVAKQAAKPEVKYIVIEDFTQYQTHRITSDAFVADESFTKWQLFAKDISRIIAAANAIQKEVYVFFMSHVNIGKDGVSKFATTGKMLDDNIKPQGWFAYVFHTDVVEKRNGKDFEYDYVFQTNRSPSKSAKTPPGMFPFRIPNNLMLVVKGIEAYNTSQPLPDYEKLEQEFQKI